MKLLLLLPLLVGLPLAAQPDLSNLFIQNILNRVKSASQPSLLVFEETASPTVQSFRKVLQDEAISELGLALIPVPREIQIGRGGSGGVAPGDPSIPIRRHFSIGGNVRWAVVDSKEQVLLSGSTVPNANEFAQQLASKGVQSPFKILRDFLKTHPDHLDAHVELLQLQQKNADKRTRAELDIEPEPTPQNPFQNVIGDSTPSGGQTVSRIVSFSVSASGALESAPTNYRMVGSNADTPKPRPIPEDKLLDTATDLIFWGGYAELLDRLFVADDWLAVGLAFEKSEYPIEVCSPLVKGLYRRRIGQVEAALELAPSNARFWSIWVRMADTIGGRSILTVAERLAQLPGSTFVSWPEDVREKLITDARTSGKWGFLVDSLWSQYERLTGSATGQPTFFSLPTTTTLTSGSGSNQTDMDAAVNRALAGMYSQEWDSTIEPLLEALIQMNDEGRADAVVNKMKGRGDSYIQRAMGLANKCNRPDLAQRWGFLVTEKESAI